VDEADAAHIFDRFYRAPAARGRPGSGLGLAIVAQVVRDEGGSVDVQRGPTGGALFRLFLPEVTPPTGTPPSA
jgi:two-component system sensor histidine kinase MprB